MRGVASVSFTCDRLYEVNCGKLDQLIGFTPASFETGVSATVRSFAFGA
jgi:hypothetical protein